MNDTRRKESASHEVSIVVVCLCCARTIITHTAHRNSELLRIPMLLETTRDREVQPTVGAHYAFGTQSQRNKHHLASAVKGNRSDRDDWGVCAPVRCVKPPRPRNDNPDEMSARTSSRRRMPEAPPRAKDSCADRQCGMMMGLVRRWLLETTMECSGRCFTRVVEHHW